MRIAEIRWHRLLGATVDGGWPQGHEPEVRLPAPHVVHDAALEVDLVAEPRLDELDPQRPAREPLDRGGELGRRGEGPVVLALKPQHRRRPVVVAACLVAARTGAARGRHEHRQRRESPPHARRHDVSTGHGA